MRKSILIVSLSVIIGISGCKKEKSNPTALITGKWHWVEQVYDGYTNNQLTSHEDYTATLDPLSYFEFDADGKFIENPQDKNGSFKYGTYQLQGDSLIINDSGDISRWAIKTLSSSSLVIHETTGESPYRGEVTYSMKK